MTPMRRRKWPVGGRQLKAEGPYTRIGLFCEIREEVCRTASVPPCNQAGVIPLAMVRIGGNRKWAKSWITP
jgi:hypothetical protein